jgi:hypothetical protein
MIAHSGVCGQVVKVIDFKPLVLHCCLFKSCQRLWILIFEGDIQLAYEILVVLLSCWLVPEIMQGHLRSYSINNAGKSPYIGYSVGGT